MVNCDFHNFGCDGGYLINSIDFLAAEGVTTYDCVPYTDVYGKCDYTCEDPNDKYEKYYCDPGTMSISTSSEEIQLELMTNGPMMVGLMVFEDFVNYESGVYHQTTGEMVGGHAMKLVGWGTSEEGELYWIC